jgi:hypothetical protein
VAESVFDRSPTVLARTSSKKEPASEQRFQLAAAHQAPQHRSRGGRLQLREDRTLNRQRSCYRQEIAVPEQRSTNAEVALAIDHAHRVVSERSHAAMLFCPVVAFLSCMDSSNAFLLLQAAARAKLLRPKANQFTVAEKQAVHCIGEGC